MALSRAIALPIGARRPPRAISARDVRAAANVLAFSWFAVALLTGIGGILRFNHLGMAGLLVDEGFTVTYARQGWAAVLGLHGFYDPHPPLFLAFAKFADLFVAEEIAGRAVAALAGTLTIPLVFLLCRRLIGTGAGIAAAALLAVAPFHVEYSRIGRMYAPAVFLVTASYYALIMFGQTGQRRWAAAYSAALVLAMYTDYSAAYALLPQALLLLLMLRRDPEKRRPLLVAGGIAALLYLPWLPQVFNTISGTANAEGRDDYLAASWSGIAESAGLIFGLGSRRFWDGAPTDPAWTRWTDWRWAMVGLFVLAAVNGIVAAALARRGISLLVCALMTIGTAATAIGLSQVSPGYASRTVMIATVGWAILASLFLVNRPLPKAVRAIGALSWCAVLALTFPSLELTYHDGRAEEFPVLTDELVSLAALGKPILIFSTAGMLTDVVNLYAGDQLAGNRIVTLLDGKRESYTGAGRWLSRGITIAEMEEGKLEEALPPADPGSDAFWFVSRFGGYYVRPYFYAAGYRQLGVIRLGTNDIELWSRAGAVLGTPVAMDGRDPEGGSWEFTRSVVPRGNVASGDFEIVLDRPSSRAVLTLPGGEFLYSVEAEVWTSGFGPQSGVGRLSLRCHLTNDVVLERMTTSVTADSQTGEWSFAGVSVLCPKETTSVVLTISRDQGTAAMVRNVVVQRFKPDNPTST